MIDNATEGCVGKRTRTRQENDTLLIDSWKLEGNSEFGVSKEDTTR
jgi:hypothetical protein